MLWLEDLPPLPRTIRAGFEKRVLVVEGSDDRSSELVQALEARGIPMVVARNGYHAVRRVSRERFSVILAAADSAGVSGLELARSVLKHSPETAILLTADRGNYSLYREALRAGARMFLFRPLQPKKLAVMIEVLAEAVPPQRGPRPEESAEFRARSVPPLGSGVPEELVEGRLGDGDHGRVQHTCGARW